MTYRDSKTVEIDRAIMSNVKKAVCVYYNIKGSNIFKNNRKRDIVNGRHVFHYLSHVVFGIPSGVVGNFSERDHATVLHSSGKVKGWLDVDRQVQKEVKDILEMYNEPTKWRMIKVTVKQFISDLFKIITLRT